MSVVTGALFLGLYDNDIPRYAVKKFTRTLCLIMPQEGLSTKLA